MELTPSVESNSSGCYQKLWYYYIQRKDSTLHRFRTDFIKSMKSVCLLCGNMLRIRRQNVAI